MKSAAHASNSCFHQLSQNSQFQSFLKKRSLSALLKAALSAAFAFGGLTAVPAFAADVTLTSANNSGYSWGTAGETLNVTLDPADKFAGPLTITAGTVKLASNYATNTLGTGATISLGAGTMFDFNGTFMSPASISTTGAVTITSTLENSQNGLSTISSLGGDLTLHATKRFCLTGVVSANNYEIIKTGGNEIVVKANLNNLKALRITAGTWSVENNVAGFGTGDIHLEFGGTMKVWGSGRNVTFSTLYHNGGTVELYTDGYSGTINLTGNIVLEADNANFKVSSTTTFIGDISGAGKTLVHSARVAPGGNGDQKDQTGVWKFQGASATDKSTTTLANFKLTTRDSEIILGDNSEWNLTGGVLGSSTGHKFTVGANASLTADSISGIKTLALNGASTLGSVTMNQADGSLTIGAATTLGSLNFTANTALTTNANLSTTGTSTLNSGVTVTKTGTGTLLFGGQLTGAGKLDVQAGTLSQATAAANVKDPKLTAFTGEIILGSGTTLSMNGQQVFNGPTVTCKDGSKITNTVGNGAVNWDGINKINVESGATVELAGTARFGFALLNGTANGGTLKLTNTNYLFLSSKIENATLDINHGVLGIEGGTTLVGSAGKEVYVNLHDGGQITSWTGTSTYTLSPTSTKVNNGTFKAQGNLIYQGPVTLEGLMTVNPVQFATGDKTYYSTIRFNGPVTGNYEIASTGPGTSSWYGDVDVSKLTLTNGAVVVKGGTFEADTFAINKSYGSSTLTGGTFESGLIVDGGSLVSNGSFTANDKTIVMRSGAMTLGGTVTDTAGTTYDVDGGTLTLKDGLTLKGKVDLAKNATLELGLDDAQPATVTLTNSNSILSGELVFDVFSDSSFDRLILGDDTNLDGVSLSLTLGEGVTGAKPLELISGLDLSEIAATITNPDWALVLGPTGISARNVNATPEPASWILLALSVLGLGFMKKRFKVQNSITY